MAELDTSKAQTIRDALREMGNEAPYQKYVDWAKAKSLPVANPAQYYALRNKRPQRKGLVLGSISPKVPPPKVPPPEGHPERTFVKILSAVQTARDLIKMVGNKERAHQLIDAIS